MNRLPKEVIEKSMNDYYTPTPVTMQNLRDAYVEAIEALKEATAEEEQYYESYGNEQLDSTYCYQLMEQISEHNGIINKCPVVIEKSKKEILYRMENDNA